MSVKKKSNGWYAYLRYRDAFGKTRQKKKEGFLTKKEAQAWEAEYRRIHEGKAVPGMTLDDLATRYFTDVRKRWKPTTWANTTSMYRHHVQPYLGKQKLDDITPATIRALQTELLANGLKAGTRKLCNTQLSSMFHYGIKYCGVVRNPVVQETIKETQPHTYHIWTQKQFDDFLKRVPDAGESDKCVAKIYKLFFRLLFYSGLREGEALALTTKDIDYQSNSIRVNKTRNCYGVTAPKTLSSNREIPMPKQIMADLKQYMSQLYPGTKFLFNFSAPAAYLRWQNWQKRYGQGLPRLRVHDLRHSHASMLLDLGVSYQAVAARLGHKNPGMVIQIYGHLYDKRKREIADKLDDLLSRRDD